MPFSPRHIPVIFQGTAYVVGGALTYVNPRQAILTFGLPEDIATSPPAQLYSTIDGSRCITLGVLLWLFYLQGNLAAVDTVLVCCGAIQGGLTGWINWVHGSTMMAIAHWVAGVFYIWWGLNGMTEGKQRTGGVRRQDFKRE